MKPRILVVGSSNIDFVCSMDRVPVQGETIISDKSYAFVPGGKGANTAVAATRLGGDVVFCTRVGDDSYGKQLSEKYRLEGIDTRFITMDKAARTGLAVIMVEETGHNRIAVYPGANMNLSAKDIEGAFTSYPDALVMQLEIDREAVIAAARLAKENGTKVFLDAGPATPDFPLEQLGQLEVLSPNETETKILTGITPNSSANCLRACIELMNRVPSKYIVLKLGDRGCYVYDGTHCHHLAPVDVGTPVDTTAAGDAFTAALAVRYMQNGGDILDACEFANAVGGYVVTKAGAFPSIPTLRELKEFLKKGEE
ncbi:MAG: ribokinase [Clostridia bacterium]|nr:ribokinase [Clostridia bacterium]